MVTKFGSAFDRLSFPAMGAAVGAGHREPVGARRGRGKVVVAIYTRQLRVGEAKRLESCADLAKLTGVRRMSTKTGAKDGGKTVADQLVAQSKALFEAAAAEQEQLDLLDPISPEEMALAQEELGPNAGNIAVLQHARAKKKGRPLGSRNKRTDDFAAYILQFGHDPARTLMEIQSTAPEMLVERSRQLDPVKRRLAYGDAQALRVRCAEALMPYLHGKKPVTVDANIRGVMVVEELGDTVARGVTIDHEPLGVMPIDGDER